MSSTSSLATRRLVCCLNSSENQRPTTLRRKRSVNPRSFRIAAVLTISRIPLPSCRLPTKSASSRFPCSGMVRSISGTSAAQGHHSHFAASKVSCGDTCSMATSRARSASPYALRANQDRSRLFDTQSASPEAWKMKTVPTALFLTVDRYATSRRNEIQFALAGG